MLQLGCGLSAFLWAAVALAQVRPGPAPDYVPLAQVRTHVQTRQLAPDFVAELDSIAGPHHVAVGSDSELGTLIWLRDYHPLFIRDASGRKVAVQPRTSLHERKGVVVPGAEQPVDLGILHENGNLVVIGRRAFLTDRIIEENRVDRPGMENERKAMLLHLARTLSMGEEDVVIMPQLPGEATGHIDLYLMATSDTHVLIPRIELEALIGLSEHERMIGHTAAQFLDRQADHLRQLGYRVGRLNMLPPRVLPAIDNPAEDVVYFSPANGLLLNIEGNRTVLLPDIDPSVLRAHHRKLARDYKKQWAATFQAEGWRPVFADATDLSRYLGFFRCLTSVVPD